MQRYWKLAVGWIIWPSISYDHNIPPYLIFILAKFMRIYLVQFFFFYFFIEILGKNEFKFVFLL